MFRAFFLSLVIYACTLAPAPARAHHFAIDLDVSSGKEKKTAHAEELGLGSKPKARAVVAIKAGATVKVKWKLSNIDAKATYKDVTVHFFVVKEQMLGQAFVPKLLPKDMVAESALTMDFKPKDKNEGELTFTIASAGSYMLRLETIDAAVGKDGHEHFAALDLEVSGE
jgi:hypothetical protein